MQLKKNFFVDDGDIPNSKWPALLYQDVFEARGADGASWLEKRFADNNWTNAWRNGVYDYHHYHSTSHEVLGVYAGSARLQLGGEKGREIEVVAGDVIVIPAGVGHKNLGSSPDFGVVGAYPDGSSYDLKMGRKGERPQADRNIAAVPVPSTDPLQGTDEGVPTIWEKP
ncbi:cupin domain-containing protein [Fodinibius sediminis]|uniref:Uncharacterized protein YjlB n=1 Tax=Fodinibius sediminis TaxID=1214077 RepID=A0A521EM90_9BACT|nr:cupin domain-containing protein [Fodinibius sediminis]SMO85037.1 Uncharacterized protein YjlB [Fodinibius sediminis]